MKRVLLLFLLLALLLPTASATRIAQENVTITVGEPDQVTVTRTYESITTDRVSYLVSGRYDPEGLSARDAIGELDCSIDELAVGKEILCTPRSRSNYTVTVTFTGDFTEQEGDGSVFSFANRLFVPTSGIHTSVILPEGYGLVEGDGAVQPDEVDVGSEGRRIFLEWSHTDPGLGDVIQYRVEYEELAVFERIALQRLTILLALAVIALSVAVFYIWWKRGGEKTIAAIFPVLKEDEQEVVRYIIDHEGEVEQRDIVMDLDYSKAKVSSLISDLAERSLVEKEKRGRINVVRLARDVGDLDGE